MDAWRDSRSSFGERFNQISGKTRFVVCRLFIHVAGQEAAPLLGVLNRAAREAIAADGDLVVLGEGLVEICQNLLQYDTYWQSAANEGDVFWDEGDAADYLTELFTDSAQRYLSGPVDQPSAEAVSLPVTQNLIVMITIACIGTVPELETDLSQISALKAALKTLINLHYQGKLQAIQVHFSPAQLGDRLTSDQLILNFPELIPL